MKYSYLILFSVIFCLSCKKDTPTIKDEKVPVINSHDGVFINNEGGFGHNNSSVSYYKYSDKSITEDLFKAANNKPLGDICQSIEIFNGKAYLVINNSGKVEIVDPVSFSSLGVIAGLTSPRYFLGINPAKAYVSDLKSNHISVIDLNSNTLVKEIYCQGWTEEMLLHEGKAYVTNIRKEYIYVVDTNNDIIEDSIKVGPAPGSIQIDKNNKIWVMGGDSYNKKIGSLCRIDPKLRKVEMKLEFQENDSPTSLRINGSLDTLYYLNIGVWMFPIDQQSPASAPLIPLDNRLFYGLGIDPACGEIFVSDAIDYVQNGRIYIYNSSGMIRNTFSAGIIPGGFKFY